MRLNSEAIQQQIAIINIKFMVNFQKAWEEKKTRQNVAIVNPTRPEDKNIDIKLCTHIYPSLR